MTHTIQKTVMLFDFSKPEDIAQWYAHDDVVMGGVSASGMQSTKQQTAVFTGNVFLDNNGGFAAVRSHAAEYDLHAFMGIELRYKGDGKRYGVNIRNDSGRNGLRYQASFITEDAIWTTTQLPFADFIATRRGKTPPDAPPLDRARISSFGLIIANKQAEPFCLELAWIKAYTL